MTTHPILKEDALAAYQGRGSDLAKALGITPSAVYQWEDGEPIPNEQALKLRFILKPELFGGTKPPRTKAKAA